MNITTHRTGGDKSMRWCAYDDDIYDGAPDSGWPSNCLGHGPTELQAVYDYLCQRGLDEELDAKEQALIWTKIAAKENSEDMIETAAKMADYFDDVLGGLMGPMDGPLTFVEALLDEGAIAVLEAALKGK